MTAESWSQHYPKGLQNIKNGKLIRALSKKAFEKSAEHIFSKEHLQDGIDLLGKNRVEIIDKVIKVILDQDRLGKLSKGSNQIHLVLEGHKATIRVNIADGTVRSFNAFKNRSNKVMSSSHF